MRNNKTVRFSIIVLASLFTAITALAIYLLTVGLEQTFTGSVAWLAHSFADEVAHHTAMASQDEQTLQQELTNWAEKVVQEYLLYAQVVKGGKTLAEARAPQAINLKLDAETLSSEMSVTKGRLADGVPYLDMLKALETPDGSANSESYLRIGVSLARVSSAIQMGALILALAGLMGIFLGALLMLRLSKVMAAREWQPATALELAQASAGVADNGQGRDNSLWQVGQLLIDDRRKEVRISGRSAKLTPREYAVLKVLASEPQRVFADQEIIAQVWPENSLASADDVRKYIRFLRKKLEEDPTRPQVIVTIKGFGYKLQA